MIVNDRELDVVRYVAMRGFIKLAELEDYISGKWGIGIKASYRVVKRLVDRGVLRFRRIDDTIYVELSPRFVSFIVEIYGYLIEKQRHRVDYAKKKMYRDEYDYR